MDTLDVERRLRRSLAARAEAVDPPRPDLGRVVAAARSEQRRHRRALAGAALAVALVVAGPLALGRLSSGGGTAGPGTSVAGVLDVPTRGSLAGDAAALERLTRLPWSAAGTEATDRHVLFAGDVADGRVWALVTGRAGDGAYAVWVDRAGSAAPRLVRAARPVDPETPLALLDVAGGRGVLLVVGLPGDRPALPGGDTAPFTELAPGVTAAALASPGDPAPLTLTVDRDVPHGGARFDVTPSTFDSAGLGAGAAAAEASAAAGPHDAGYGARMHDCLLPLGFPVTVRPDGSFHLDDLAATAEQLAAYGAAVDSCDAAVGSR